MLKNQTAHTPGPWKAERGAAVSYSGEPYQIVSLHNGEAHYIAKVDAVKKRAYDEVRNSANARLIAAAPELTRREAGEETPVGPPRPLGRAGTPWRTYGRRRLDHALETNARGSLAG